MPLERSRIEEVVGGGNPKQSPNSVVVNRTAKKNARSCDNLIKKLDFAELVTEDVWTCDKTLPVRIRTIDSAASFLKQKPVCVMKVFLDSVEKFGSHAALAAKIDGKWKTWTYEEYYEDVLKAAKALIALGLQRFDGVGIIGFNSPEWVIADLATIFAGGLATGIYATSTPDACKYVISSAECSIVIVENDVQLQKILSIRSQLPRLKAVVQYKGELSAHCEDDVYTWKTFMRMGENISDDILSSRIKGQHCNQCCTIIYTSGTIGNPKGVMLSHDNLIFAARTGGDGLNVKEGSEVIVSYLPLSHVAAQIVDIYFAIVNGITIYFAQPDAQKGTLIETLKEVRPTIFFGVPRVYEKMAEKMAATFKANSRLKQKLIQWSRNVGLRGNISMLNGGSTPFGWTIAKRLIFSKIRKALGFDRCIFSCSGAAPISREALEFFASINIPVFEALGLSESSGPHVVSLPSKGRLTSVGAIKDYCPVFLDKTNAEGEGEICFDGRNIFMGYLNDPEKTRETFDEKFRLRTGDLGKIDKDGFVYVTGRIKELIITAGGENVPPVPIEDAVKESLSQCISNCMLIGDKRKFLSLLITLKTEIDAETSEPKDELTSDVVEWFLSLGSRVKTVSELLARAKTNADPVFAAIQAGIDRANQKAVSRAQQIQKWSILPRDFSIPGGELGPTMKLRRFAVAQLYSETIESFYRI